ncbi:MAG TPA: hypothetical protein VGH87_07950, partial [Polyangiaceae bacterium]
AYFGTDDLFQKDAINLESQVWALIGGTLTDDQRKTLVQTIASELDDPSAFGAMLGKGGQVWPAISGLLTWGYALSDAPRAWKHLQKNTMAAHALAFPNLWYGIWSGPDGWSAGTGEAWYSAATPMTDFPVQNANQHSMPLLALLRVCGIEASATGLVIDPHAPGDFSIETSLLDLERKGQLLTGTYRPATPRTIEVRGALGASTFTATTSPFTFTAMRAY